MYRYCVDNLRAEYPEIYVIFRLAKIPKDIWVPVFHLNFELAKISSEVTERQISEIKLKWWKESIEKLYEVKTPINQPTLAILHEAILRYDIKKDDLLNLVEAYRFDIGNLKHKNWKEFEKYVDESFFKSFEIVFKGLKISVLPKQKKTLQKLCYVLKVIRVAYSLKGISYNENIFINEEVVQNLQKFQALLRQEESFCILKKYVKKQMPKFERFDGNFLISKISIVTLHVVHKTLKRNSLSELKTLKDFQLLSACFLLDLKRRFIYKCLSFKKIK
jgi:hypothetical protein